MPIYSGFPHEKWWFSIAMLNYQRVNLHMQLISPHLMTPGVDPIPAVASPWQRSWQSTGSPDSASVLKCTPAAPKGDGWSFYIPIKGYLFNPKMRRCEAADLGVSHFETNRPQLWDGEFLLPFCRRWWVVTWTNNFIVFLGTTKLPLIFSHQKFPGLITPILIPSTIKWWPLES